MLQMFFCNSETLTKDYKDQPFNNIKWIINIKQILPEKSLIAGNRVNAYYCPNLVRPSLRICDKYPLLSIVMVDYLSSSSKMVHLQELKGIFQIFSLF